ARPRSPPTCPRPGAWALATTRRAAASASEPEDVAGGDGLRKALEREAPESLDLDGILDAAIHALRDQDLAGLRLAAQARREVGDGADRAVVQAPFEADRADRGVPLGDPDAEVDVIAAL